MELTRESRFPVGSARAVAEVRRRIEIAKRFIF